MFVHNPLSGMVLSVLDVRPGSFMPVAAATVLTEPSLTAPNVPLEPATDVSEFLTPTGTEPTVSASQVSPPAVIHVIVTASSLATIAKDVLPNLTLSGPMEFVNVTMVTLT